MTLISTQAKEHKSHQLKQNPVKSSQQSSWGKQRKNTARCQNVKEKAETKNEIEKAGNY